MESIIVGVAALDYGKSVADVVSGLEALKSFG